MRFDFKLLDLLMGKLCVSARDADIYILIGNKNGEVKHVLFPH